MWHSREKPHSNTIVYITLQKCFNLTIRLPTQGTHLLRHPVYRKSTTRSQVILVHTDTNVRISKILTCHQCSMSTMSVILSEVLASTLAGKQNFSRSNFQGLVSIATNRGRCLFSGHCVLVLDSKGAIFHRIRTSWPEQCSYFQRD